MFIIALCCTMYRMMGLEARDGAFYLEGKKIQIVSGAMHYFRVVPDYWEDTLTRLKACGLNCVETYVSFVFIPDVNVFIVALAVIEQFNI